MSKKEEDDHGPLGHQRTSRLSDGPFCSLPGALHANKRLPLASQIVLFVEFFTKTSTAHTARKSMAVLREMFPGRLISLTGDISWPARSPDLTPCDYFLWGYYAAHCLLFFFGGFLIFLKVTFHEVTILEILLYTRYTSG